MLLVHLNYF